MSQGEIRLRGAAGNGAGTWGTTPARNVANDRRLLAS